MFLEIRRILDHPIRQYQRDDADRYVDQKNPAPGDVVNDKATQGWSDHRRQNHRHPVNRERHSELIRRKSVSQDGLLTGLQSATAGALYHAEKNQTGKRRRYAA